MSNYYPDISHYHPVRNWGKVKSNCPFLIAKATQGTSYIDETLDTNIRECEKRGIPYSQSFSSKQKTSASVPKSPPPV